MLRRCLALWPAEVGRLYRLLAMVPLLPEVSLPRLTGEMLVGVVHRKGATAGSLDGWGWREFKALPVSWFDGLARNFYKG